MANIWQQIDFVTLQKWSHGVGLTINAIKKAKHIRYHHANITITPKIVYHSFNCIQYTTMLMSRYWTWYKICISRLNNSPFYVSLQNICCIVLIVGRPSLYSIELNWTATIYEWTKNRVANLMDDSFLTNRVPEILRQPFVKMAINKISCLIREVFFANTRIIKKNR